MFWNPIFATVFFTYLNLWDGKSVAELKQKVVADLPTAVMGSWAYWVPAHTVNFRFIPGEQRVLYINCLQIMYNMFLSFLGNKEVKADERSASACAAVPSVGTTTPFQVGSKLVVIEELD